MKKILLTLCAAVLTGCPFGSPAYTVSTEAIRLDFFGWGEDYTWARYSLGSLFVLYGFWRAYRQIKIAR